MAKKLASDKSVLSFLICISLTFTLAFFITGCPPKPTPQPDEPRTGQEEPRPKEARNLGYVGSNRCRNCHPGHFDGWEETLHRKMVQDASKQDVVMGNFAEEGNPLRAEGVNRDDIVYVAGSKWIQRYVIERDKNFLFLPSQWNVKTSTWQDYKPEEWQENPWQDSCIACHTTGYSAKARQFNEAGIGCEACHGPGEDHVKGGASKDIVNPEKLDKKLSTDICGQCHVRGKNKDGQRDDALGFKVGEKLEDVFAPLTPATESDKTSAEAAFFPDGASRKHHQQYNDYIQSAHYKSGKVSCADCHEAHAANSSAGDLPLKEGSVNALCTKCHREGGSARALQLPIKLDEYMPLRAKSDNEADIRSHTFKLDQPKTPVEKEPYLD